MKISKMFFKTYREDPVDAEIKSHKLLLRAGYIKKQSSGVYMFLPLGLKVLNNICNIVKDEMDNAGAQQTQMTCLLPVETYAGRIEHFGEDMFKLFDRTNKQFCLGASHEEVFVNVMKDAVNSYKQLPQILYQIQTKFRDEKRPRFGLQRGKEFLMKDAYSFDKDEIELDKSYNLMSDTYKKIFTRLGLDFVVVDADNGNMGGSGSQEFMVKSNVGEDEIVICNSCGYASNTEKAECLYSEKKSQSNYLKMEKKYTPNQKTIEELVEFLHQQPQNFLKAVVYKCEKGIIVALLAGDREIEEVKLARALNVMEVEMCSHEEIEKIGSVAGFVGAINLKNCIVIADNDVKNMENFIIGANQLDYHYINTNLKDIKINQYADIKKAQAGDICVHCGKPYSIIRGIEVGHIFKQQTKYTKAQECTFLDENGRLQYMQMGAYGIGITRTMSAIVEQFSDDRGIIWPENIAPYRIVIVVANVNDKNQNKLAETIYDKLKQNNIKVLLDDRKESIGVKLKDAELIGISNILIIGKYTEENKVELIKRASLEKEILNYLDAINRLK